MSLEDIFNPQEEKVEEVQEEQQELPLEESETTSQEEEAEEVESKDEPKEEIPKEKEEDTEKQDWTLKAVQDERRKRQDLERQLEELRKQNEKPEESVSVFDDEKAAFDKIRDEYRQEVATVKVEIAREMMMDTHKDYEQMEKFFIEEIAPNNPFLQSEVQKASNPAKFVYENAKKYQQYQEMQDVDGMRERLKSELRKELEAEIQGKQESRANKVSDITPSLAKARASDKDTFVPTTLDNLFGG
jgi:hypothetical protein